MGVTAGVTRGITRAVTNAITGMGASSPPSVTVGPTLTDNADGTFTLDVTFDSACYCGFDYGTATATYTQSALSYTHDDPNDVGGLLFSTTHSFTIPEQALGTETLAEADYFGRLAAGGVSYNSFGYVNAEQTFTVALGPPGSPAHWYKKATGITGTTSVSQWDDQIGSDHLVQATGLKQPAYSAGIVTFSGGTDPANIDRLAASFTLNQPFTIGLKMRQVSWTNDRYFMDGANAFSALFGQNGTTPGVKLYAGSLSAEVPDFPVDANFHSVIVVFNGSSSIISVDGVETTGLVAGSSNAGGLTLGEVASGGQGANFAMQEAVLYTSAFDATARAALKSYLDGV